MTTINENGENSENQVKIGNYNV